MSLVPLDRELAGRKVLIIERDAARAGKLVLALRALGASAGRADSAEQGLDRARELRPDVVLVDGEAAEEWASATLDALSRDPVLRRAVVIRTDAAAIWTGDEADPRELIDAVNQVTSHHARMTRQERAVDMPAPIVAPVIVPPTSTPALAVAPVPTPTASPRRVASAKQTERYGAIAAPSPAPPSEAPMQPTEPAPAPMVGKSGYVFPSRGASAEVESARSSKETSLELTVVPSPKLSRTEQPTTDHMLRVDPGARRASSSPGRWSPWRRSPSWQSSPSRCPDVPF